MNLQRVEDASRVLLGGGVRLLHVHRFAPTDAGHLARLLHWAELPQGARVMDMGCGTGEMARQWAALRPDLDWVLVNLSPLQLAYAPDAMRQRCCDMRSVPEGDGSFDAVVCCFAIGHEDAGEVYREMARLLAPGGVAFVYDMVGDGSKLVELDYTVGDRGAMERAGRGAGLVLDWYMEPTDQLQECVVKAYFDPVRPAIWRWVKP